MLEHGSRMGQRFHTALFVGDWGSDEDGRGAGPSSSRALPPASSSSAELLLSLVWGVVND